MPFPPLEGGGMTAVFRFLNNSWQGEPGRGSLPCEAPIVGQAQAMDTALALTPQPDGALAGAQTTTIQSNECGLQGAVITVPVLATRLEDVPPGSLVADPAAVADPLPPAPALPPPSIGTVVQIPSSRPLRHRRPYPVPPATAGAAAASGARATSGHQLTSRAASPKVPPAATHVRRARCGGLGVLEQGVSVIPRTTERPGSETGLECSSVVRDTGIEPVTSSVSGKRSPAELIARVETLSWRWRRESNPCARLCRPLPHHSATPPLGLMPQIAPSSG